MLETTNELEIFGKFITKNLRDHGIEYFDTLMNGLCKSPNLYQLEDNVREFYLDQVKIIRKCVVKTIDNAIHDFLSALQEKTCIENKIEITVNGVNIALASSCLQAEPYSQDGWYSKFSKFGEAKD